MDEKKKQLLEDAFLKDCVDFILQTEDGSGYEYNFREMTQTSMPPTEDHAPMTGSVRRVHDVHEVSGTGAVIFVEDHRWVGRVATMDLAALPDEK